MRMSGKTGVSCSLILLIAVFVCAGFRIYNAGQLAKAAPNEKTAAAHVVSVEHHIFRYLRFNFYSCEYTFSVDGSFYVENQECPHGIADDAARGKYSDAGTSMDINATVYYDPTDPSVNSLLEFNTESESYYRQAVSLSCVGGLIIIFFVFGGLLTAANKRGRGGVVVDARGTVIYPEEIDFGLGSDGLFGKERKTEGAYGQAANLKSANAADPAPSPGLRELYLEVVNNIHPDRAANEVDRALRERLMKEANAAFERSDAQTLRRVLEEYKGAIPAS
jgi:hypothetical protein